MGRRLAQARIDRVMKMKSGYYQADCINGVHYLGELLEDSGIEVERPDIFQMRLKDLGEDEVIVTFLDCTSKDIFDEIEARFGPIN
jgi:hypothetical protein